MYTDRKEGIDVAAKVHVRATGRNERVYVVATIPAIVKIPDF